MNINEIKEKFKNILKLNQKWYTMVKSNEYYGNKLRSLITMLLLKLASALS
jgi:hypothetical protein